MSHWIEIAIRNAKDLLARMQESADNLATKYPDSPRDKWHDIISVARMVQTLQDILLARHFEEARTMALAVLLAYSSNGRHKRYERNGSLRKAGLAFKNDHDRRSDARDEHIANLSRTIRGEAMCGDWEEVALVLLEERMVPPGGEAERLLLEELAGHVTNEGGPTDRIRKIMVERGFRFCPACDLIAEPVTACGCLDCPVCGAAETGLQSDEVPASDGWAWGADDHAAWKSVATKHKPECAWVQTRGYQLPTIPV